LNPPANTGTTPVAPPEESQAVDPDAELEEAEETGGGFPWGWLFFILVALAIAATFFWPGFLSQPGEDPVNVQEEPVEAATPPAEAMSEAEDPAAETSRPPLVPPAAQTEPEPVVAAEPGEGLIYLVAFGEKRNTGVYWDGVYQGRVGELEVGMLVDPGDHRLVVVTRANDTLLDKMLTILPNDTLDIEVK
jgi:hypothetical protein